MAEDKGLLNVEKFKDATFEEKIKLLDEYQMELVHQLDKILCAESHGSREASQLITLINNLTKSVYFSVYKKREIESKDDIDFNHPKIQRSYYFLLELVIHVLEEMNVTQPEIRDFVSRMGIKLIGFEDKMNVALRKLSTTMLERSQNPLVSKMLQPGEEVEVPPDNESIVEEVKVEEDANIV